MCHTAFSVKWHGYTLKDAIIALSLRNMFLTIGMIGWEGPSIVLEDLEHWFGFAIGADFHDLKAGLLI